MNYNGTHWLLIKSLKEKCKKDDCYDENQSTFLVCSRVVVWNGEINYGKGNCFAVQNPN